MSSSECCGEGCGGKITREEARTFLTTCQRTTAACSIGVVPIRKAELLATSHVLIALSPSQDSPPPTGASPLRL